MSMRDDAGEKRGDQFDAVDEAVHGIARRAGAWRGFCLLLSHEPPNL